MTLSDLRAVMERNGPIWSTVLAQDIDPDTIVARPGTTGPTASCRSACGSPRSSITERTTGARSARRSPRWASSRPRSSLGLRGAGRPHDRGADPCLTGAGDDRRRLFRRGRRGHIRRL